VGWLVVAAIIVLGGATFAVAGFLSAIQDPFVRYALAIVSVQVAILLLLSFGLVAGKHVLLKRSQARTTRISGLRELFAQFALGSQIASRLDDESGKHPGEFLEVVEESLQVLRGSARRRVEELLEKSHVYPRLLRMAAEPDPGHALRAISLLSRVNNSECEAAVETALSHPAPIVQMAARVAVLSGSNQQAQRRVLQELPKLTFWQRAVLFQQISSGSSVLQQFLSDALQSPQDDIALAALECILSHQRFVPVPHFERLAQSNNAEIRIKFFKALPLLSRDSSVLLTLKAGLADPDWRVRAMAARACGHLKAAGLTAELLAIVQCTSVAAEVGHAARALAAIGGEARRQLQTLPVRGSEMAHRIVTEVIEKEILLGAEVSS
jgi:hypothetical protein